MKKKLFGIPAYAILLIISLNISAQTVERSQVEPKYTWNLAEIYPSDTEWTKAKDELLAGVPKLESYKGKLGSSSQTLLEFLNNYFEFLKLYNRVYSYASMKSDEDLGNNTYQGMMQVLRQNEPVIGAAMAYSEPELLAAGKEKIDNFLAENKDLGVYRMYFDELFRQQKHLLSEKEEKILAQASALLGAPHNIFSVFINNDLPFPEAVLSSGDTVLVNIAGYSRYRASPVKADRELIFKTFWSTMKKFEATFSEQLLAGINANIFVARARNYESALQAAVDRYNVQPTVYHSLIENVNNNLPIFHRYLGIRKQLLKVDTLKYSDIYAPVVANVDLEYSYDEARNLIINSLLPLGTDYQQIVTKAFDDRWLDVYPTPGKRSGAYSNGSVYDVHPYMLLNYNGQYNDVSTVTHELGHTLQSYMSNKSQPFPLADYPIFTAEVASTFNEVLLNDYLVKNIKDDNVRLSLLMSNLDNFKSTLFRQTQFAEFELAIHQLAEAGEPLTSEVLNQKYGDIIRKYYGHDQGVCMIDELYNNEWSFIPHFYYNFYVYQYSTSFTASMALAGNVIDGDQASQQKYLAFLSAGGSKYPIDLLKDAGVDMTSDVPFTRTISLMNEIMDEVDEILAKQGNVATE
jgi:oligoendopeptidase F